MAVLLADIVDANHLLATLDSGAAPIKSIKISELR
jgi:hypothetical protein